MIKEAYNPTLGSTPAIIEKAIASGINASATTAPAKRSALTFESQSRFIVLKFNLPPAVQVTPPLLELTRG